MCFGHKYIKTDEMKCRFKTCFSARQHIIQTWGIWIIKYNLWRIFKCILSCLIARFRLLEFSSLKSVFIAGDSLSLTWATSSFTRHLSLTPVHLQTTQPQPQGAAALCLDWSSHSLRLSLTGRLSLLWLRWTPERSPSTRRLADWTLSCASTRIR